MDIIAGPSGEYDWIVMDPSIDFAALFKDFDTALMGRRSFEIARENRAGFMSGMKTVVCSRTLEATDYPNVEIIHDAVREVASLKAEPGKDIWLFGGGDLFRSLLDAQLVDTIEVSVAPILLSQGIPLLPLGQRSPQLTLTEHKILPSGIATLCYAVKYE